MVVKVHDCLERSLTISTSIKLEDDLNARLNRLATARHRAPMSIIEEAIAQYVEREEKRESLRLETRQSWEQFEQDGLHVPFADIEAWLASWGSDNELPPPKCQT